MTNATRELAVFGALIARVPTQYMGYRLACGVTLYNLPYWAYANLSDENLEFCIDGIRAVDSRDRAALVHSRNGLALHIEGWACDRPH
jgi:hypothetical protein